MLHRSTTRRRRGIVLVLVAFGLVSILGVVALAVDGGVLQLKYREARARADAAAMAAACVLYEEYPKNLGTDPDKHAADAAIANGKQNGIKNDGTTSKIVVNIPPLSGPYKDLNSYAEVYVTYYVPRAFSRVFGTAPVEVKARAVARGAWVSPKVGMLILDYDDNASLNAQGNGAFTEVAAPVIVNSNNTSATVAAGSGVIKAEEFYITGGLSLSGGSSLQAVPDPSKVYLGTHPTPDPLAYLPVPPVPANGKMSKVTIGLGTQYSLTPGRYTNLPKFNTGDVVILHQASTNTAGGIFYIDGGGLNSNGASIQMGSGTGGVMIYNKPAGINDSIQITGDPVGSVVLSGLTGGPYQGISIWQDRTSAVDMNITGSGNFNIQGTVYAAGARLNITGDGKNADGDITGWYIDPVDGAKIDGTTRMASQYISRNLALTGNGNVNLNYTASGTARTRIITLVE
jgi:hypothetical protein